MDQDQFQNGCPQCEPALRAGFQAQIPLVAVRGLGGDPYDPEEVENRIMLEMLSRRALARKGIGAYRDRDDPEVAYVYACAHSAGGKFSAFRVKGRWKRPSGPVTSGDLADDYLPITDVREVEALLAEARRAFRLDGDHLIGAYHLCFGRLPDRRPLRRLASVKAQ